MTFLILLFCNLDRMRLEVKLNTTNTVNLPVKVYILFFFKNHKGILFTSTGYLLQKLFLSIKPLLLNCSLVCAGQLLSYESIHSHKTFDDLLIFCCFV